jgi:pimeloyl-ACP methyl ester carboxylesterase
MHGGGQTRHSWSGAMRALLANGYRVINFDSRGHGDSGWSPDGVYTMPQRAMDLAVVLRDVRGPVAFVGASLGGITALFAVGMDIEPSPSAIVLVDIVPRPDPVGAARILKFMQSYPGGFPSLEEAADAIAIYNPNRPRPKDVSGLARNLRKREDGRWYWHWDTRMLEEASRPEIASLGDTLAPYVRKVRVPTLLVRGMTSDIVTDDNVEEFKSQLPSLEIFNVHGAGHMVAGDKNDAFNDGVIQFLKRHVPVDG